MPVIKADSLSSFASALFEKVGVGNREARIVSQSLIGANLRGYDSHGVMRIPFYVAAIRDGRVQPAHHGPDVQERDAAHEHDPRVRLVHARPRAQPMLQNHS